MITLDKYCKTSKDLVQFSTPDDIKEQAFALDENFMIALTKGNAEKAHACVVSNSRYSVSADKKYYESIGKHLADYTLAEFERIIGLISTSNSTRSPKQSTDALARYIYDNRDGVLGKLEAGDIGLVEDLENCVGLPRKEKSLVSKICAYLCEYEFGKYSFIINDNVVRNVLPYYLAYYNVDKSLWTKRGELKGFDQLSYGELHMLLKEIQDAVSDDLSLRDIDHILWYCYKTDAVRTSIAKEIVLRNL
ncbi:MAG: hypothetical protein IJW89_02090 [Clostridia bacterium]|nr:hypothetical protein [Clostridia bacterium]